MSTSNAKKPLGASKPSIEKASISQGLYPKSARHQSSEANVKGGDSGL